MPFAPEDTSLSAARHSDATEVVLGAEDGSGASRPAEDAAGLGDDVVTAAEGAADGLTAGAAPASPTGVADRACEAPLEPAVAAVAAATGVATGSESGFADEPLLAKDARGVEAACRIVTRSR